MNRLVIRLVAALASSVVAFIVADVLLDDFSVEYPAGLIFPVLIFTAATVLLGPVIDALLEKYATWAAIFLGLIVTFLALLITDLTTESLEIEGALTWVLATVIVWLASIVTAVAVRRSMVRDPLPGRDGR
jgi:uncharacterized membrane protein